MNERGTYGHGHQALTNGYGAHGCQGWNARPPVVGVSPEMKEAAVEAGADVIGAVFLTWIGAWLGGKALPKDRDKGRIIGGAAGYFASLLAAQKGALQRIANNPVVVVNR